MKYYCPFVFDPLYPHMYRNENTMQPDPYTYPGNFPGALRLIEGAVAGEREDELFYDYLINAAPTQEAKNIIASIRDDEIKHNKMFRKIYTELTGKVLPPTQDMAFEKPPSYCDGIKRALQGELGAVQRYRRILFALQNRVHINMLTEIITDEIRHANLYNFLFTLGRCAEKGGE
ncbi:ferritin-like domain-containing protein [Clostridium pasteurianum]|uniref:Rubrerythrin diiron-binding domain-containing protein n=1 Tax=Clostridium pasteurianum BC1 TaxID=86416 RepID=R4K921_CLOPA|nr:ferritin-like domain-containing protein [Clostridium pasteurianum]AGK97004.1 hypothetical protein Clopa_2125 [Clostridium pasteurianum BC1]